MLKMYNYRCKYDQLVLSVFKFLFHMPAFDGVKNPKISMPAHDDLCWHQDAYL